MKSTHRAYFLAAAMLLSAPALAQEPQPAPTAARAVVDTGPWHVLKTESYPGKRDDISFGDAQHGWYGTGKGDLFATSDGGATWAKVAAHPGTFIRALGFIDAKTGFIGNVGTGYYPHVSDDVPLYRTDDGGVTWVPVDLHGAKVAGICSIDILRVHGRTIITAAGRVGGPTAVARSDDGGKNWHVIDLSQQSGMILDVHFTDANTGFVASSTSGDLEKTNAQILTTRDGGRTWAEVYRSQRPGELIWKMSFPTARVGYAAIMNDSDGNTVQRIAKTTDGGRTWHEMDLTADKTAVEFGVGFVDANHGFVGTMVGGFETKDGGKSWARAPIARAANKFRVMRDVKGAAVSVYAIGTQVQRYDVTPQ